MALTDTKVRSAKPEEKEYSLVDGDGMFLLVHPNGSKYWRLASIPKFHWLMQDKNGRPPESWSQPVLIRVSKNVRCKRNRRRRYSPLSL